MAKALCQDCGTISCTNLETCTKIQEFNLVVDNAKAIAKLKKWIQTTVPDFKGQKMWLKPAPQEFTTRIWCDCNLLGCNNKWNNRFITITFDPKKFSFNELTQPDLLHNYVLNALWNLRNLFATNIKLVREYHKSGIPHYHLNYTCPDVASHATLKLRLRYYFTNTLKNTKAIHDRMFNDLGKQYIKKANTTFITFKYFEQKISSNLYGLQGLQVQTQEPLTYL